MSARRRFTQEEARSVAIVADNVRRLMDAVEWSEHELARRSGVAQKTINNLLNGVTGSQIPTLDKLARPFGLSGWQLMLENLPVDAVLGNTLTLIVNKVLRTDKKGRDFILSAAERV